MEDQNQHTNDLDKYTVKDTEEILMIMDHVLKMQNDLIVEMHNASQRMEYIGRRMRSRLGEREQLLRDD